MGGRRNVLILGGREPNWVSSLTDTSFVLALQDASIVGKWQNKEIHNTFHLLSPFHFTFPLQATRCFLAMTQLGIGLLSTMKETIVSEHATVSQHAIASYITTRHYYLYRQDRMLPKLYLFLY